MSRPQPTPTGGRASSSSNPALDFAHSLAASFRSSSPLAQEYLARDIAECSDDDEGDTADSHAAEERRRPSAASAFLGIGGGDEDEEESTDSDPEPGPTLYRRPSGIAFGTSRPAMAPPLLGAGEQAVLTKVEKKQSRQAERSLLRDNHVLPPKRPLPERRGTLMALYKRLFSTRVRRADEETVQPIVVEPSETSPLLSGPGGEGSSGEMSPAHEHLNEQWEAAVAAGKIKTTWQREAKTLAVYSRALIFTFLLQYSINITSIFAVGRIGKLELGAVSLATMTANITCYAPFQGLATSLDTLCAQAYGSGHKHLVGLQLQRMTYFLMLLVLPIAILWGFAEQILATMIPERRSAELAAMYLRVAIYGTPAFVLFEGGKRFVQAQGLFHATTYVLIVAAPFNVVLNYLLVWRFGFGYVGAPMAVVTTQWLMPLLLFLYVRFVDGSQCWGGFTKRALTNWGPMIILALPGMIMVEAEYFAFEILTLITGQFGTSYLAAQSILVTVASTAFQLPFPLSIAASTRIANLIGARLVKAAKTSAKVAVGGGLILAAVNFTLLTTLRYQLPRLFTNDEEVIALVAKTMPILAGMQVFDGLATVSHGLLRGMGRQSFGGYVNLFVYYVIALPISIGTGFGLDWKLSGLWFGVTLGLLIVAAFEYGYICIADWELTVKEAEARNAAG